MIDAEGYSINVRCDGRHLSEKHESFFGRNKTQARASIRQNGWVLTSAGRTYCSRKCYLNAINKKC